MSSSLSASVDKSKSRLPAPTLFVGPPSHNASSTSLLPPVAAKDSTASNRATISRQRSHLGEASTKIDAGNENVNPLEHSLTSPLGRRPNQQQASLLQQSASQQQLQPPQPPQQSQQQQEQQRQSQLQEEPQQLEQLDQQQSAQRADALWAEMQHTLEEVELSASTTAHVFGPLHARALDELRTAQIALAQTWAKREIEDEVLADDRTKTDQPSNTADVLAPTSATGTTPATAATATPAATTAAVGHGDQIPGSGGAGGGTDGAAKADGTAAGETAVAIDAEADQDIHVGGGRTRLEEDTETDIALARKRREANDRYFKRVNTGVMEVVQKLEEVAKAMKGVEMESKEIWGDKDSLDTASLT